MQRRRKVRWDVPDKYCRLKRWLNALCPTRDLQIHLQGDEDAENALVIDDDNDNDVVDDDNDDDDDDDVSMLYVSSGIFESTCKAVTIDFLTF